ncbi:hypothetical protein [Armatimonas rosea]|uniref:Uncharacterized protein n=1 Tax=Armatimonas rosea TaxID=685828 RepID=A0A7W9SRA6_ARMRO|nr:hypothetical protein [Armatimonas rosea]MBB6050769.1 hypothetical protein [Armatimonas rosea]
MPVIELKLGWQKPLPDTAKETVSRFREARKGYVGGRELPHE